VGSKKQINQGNNSKAANRDYIEEQRNFFYSYNRIKPLELTKQNNIFRVYDNSLVNKVDALYSSVSVLIIGSFIVKFVFGLDFGTDFFNIISTVVVIWILFIFFKRFIGKKNYVILKDDKVILESKKNIELKYENIRSYLIEKALHGYSIYIYQEDKIRPEIEFNIESIHDVTAIEEFLKYKIQKIH
jgi:hypothetical protein